MDVIYADLHMHSIFSDGSYSPEGLVSLAKLRGLSVIALTDHDTTEGIRQAYKAGAYYGVKVIPGVELSCEFKGIDIHILGYFIDLDSDDLQDVLLRQKLSRKQRMCEMIGRLNKVGIDVSVDNVMSKASGGVVGRPHLANLLVSLGYAKNLQEVYTQFIGRNCPYYVPTRRLSVKDAIKIINLAKGLPVLAHPIFIPQEYLEIILENFEFWGVEVYYPEHSRRYISYLLKLVERYNLIPTGGSDFHGCNKKEDFMGRVGLDKEQASLFFHYLEDHVSIA